MMSKKSEKNNIGEIFLKNFVKAIINNAPKPQTQITEQIVETELIKEISPSKKEMIQSPKIEYNPIPVPIPSSQPQKRIILPSRELKLVGPQASMVSSSIYTTKEIKGTPQTLQIKPVADANKDFRELGLGKITPIILDPAVSSIECPGPNKPILVNKSGAIQTTNTILNSEEISNIMKEISLKTKIPLISGVFKAALGNVIVTALISEFVGTRFIIQKIIPLSQ